LKFNLENQINTEYHDSVEKMTEIYGNAKDKKSNISIY